MKNTKIQVQGSEITVFRLEQHDFISLTDIAKHKTDDSSAAIGNWMRNRNTIEFLGIWETLYNPEFKPIEFEGFKNQAGSNAFTLSPRKWIETTHAKGFVVKAGRYGGTYAHKDIAIKFASWISVEFELYLIKEFQRLKEVEQEHLGWSVKRQLTKINYRIHTDAVKENLIPTALTAQQVSLVYATEADLLNMALFGQTAKQWRDKNPDKEGNIRDYANVSQLVCLANLETLNAHFIQQGIEQTKRLALLNKTAIQQMRLLLADKGLQKLAEQPDK
ncbi:KilA-N domain-containing protein [Thiopseudomonas acetoxidans]|uniref:KilA-N domain-containing protein n=1 Tax=Thiopseudomonas acetoxidans TaxID=3041622 RepID=A0ABT7SML1_9GAMM|nr:KilA-N domain-containing protein [Thiopseudomonas sp. CY1220]MDM7857426.1 KilA-N domain-containing protein [Thiopseudomonas sp. CY1220]